MASNGFTSPFPTSHDTLGASSLNTPIFMPSSPPKLMNSFQDSAIHSKIPISARASAANATRRRRMRSSAKMPGSPQSSSGSDSEANMSDYTFDTSKLRENDDDIDTNKAEIEAAEDGKNAGKAHVFPELGGPADFTLNMVELVRGTGALRMDDKSENDASPEEEKDEAEGPNTTLPDQSMNDYSEMDTPLDMSTPAHVLSRRSLLKNETSLHKEVDRPGRLSPLDESPQDGPSSVEQQLREELKRLQGELRKKDEIIESNKRRVLDAVSAAQQIQHLQSELQKKNTALKEKDAQLSAQSSLEDEMEELRSQLQEKDEQLGKNKIDASELRSLREELEQLRNKNGQNDTNEKDGDHSNASSLHGSNAASIKMSETISAKDTQLKEHAAEIDQLKTDQDAQFLELERLDSELDIVNRECEVLEEKNADLLKALQEAETQNHNLQAELDGANSVIDSQHKAVRALAAEQSVDATVNTPFGQLIESLKVGRHSRNSSFSETKMGSERVRSLEKELAEVRLQLRNSLPSDRMQTLQLEGTRQELSESRALITVLQGEISRLSSKIESLSVEQTKLQDTLYKTTQERDQALLNVETLRKQSSALQEPSPPISPALQPTGTAPCPVDHDALLKSHEAELNSVHSAHATALSTLRDSHAETIRTLQSIITSSQARESKFESEVTSLRKSYSSLETRLAELNTERERLEVVIEAKDSAAAAIDRKFASVLKKREEEWEGRVERLLKDREKMGKVLMWTWGEKELGSTARGVGGDGKGEGKENRPPQGYKYRFVEKRGSGRAA
ncbi:hypothetical protein FQN55_006540 [Onygenales sp. PD_40]|nr:hypothetical protein FQN55_006540 [Onygenales sp. PD_40]